MEDFVLLVRRAQTGNSEAFAALVTRFQNMAYGYAYAILGDFDLAQDAAQEAFIEAYQVLPGLREPLAFPAWLKRIVFKYCDRITRRKNHRDVPIERMKEFAYPQSGLQDQLERNELCSQVQEAVRAMPDNLRTVMILFYIGGYSYEEIAEFLSVPAKTVKSRLHASRQRLKERMIAMIQDEFDHNRLPEQFTQETVEQAIQHAVDLNKDSQFDEAEKLLRTLLARVPGHPAALKELNRAIMRGRVYGKGRWNLLAELAVQGKTILKTNDDEEIHRQVAQTLLAIPTMPDSITFLENWIAEKGANLERLGMLAWAKGCSGDFSAALALWDELLALTLSSPAEQVLTQVPFIGYTLVNAFSTGGEIASAQTVARQVWHLCGQLGPLPRHETFVDDSDWLALWHMAKEDANEIVPTLLSRHPESREPAEQAVHLAIHGWLDPADAVTGAWLRWAQTCVAGAQVYLLEKYRLVSMRGLRSRGLWQAANQLAWGIWHLLGDVDHAEARQIRARWDWERFNPIGAIETRDWLAALDLVREEIKERGVEGAVGWAAIIAGGSGTPTPPEILQTLAERGVDKVDEYGMFGWYMVAREAGHAGDLTKAFDALEKALSYWANPPYWISDLWEQDAYWGSLRNRPEFQHVFDQRRKRIGTIYGYLHYFPGW